MISSPYHAGGWSSWKPRGLQYHRLFITLIKLNDFTPQGKPTDLIPRWHVNLKKKLVTQYTYLPGFDISKGYKDCPNTWLLNTKRGTRGQALIWIQSLTWEDLRRMFRWSQDWHVFHNLEKCLLMHYGEKKQRVSYDTGPIIRYWKWKRKRRTWEWLWITEQICQGNVLNFQTSTLKFRSEKKTIVIPIKNIEKQQKEDRRATELFGATRIWTMKKDWKGVD